MPIYEYDCPKCKHAFELIISHKDRYAAVCPKCSTKAITKLSLIAGHRYHGGAGEGFHKTNIKADL